VAGKTTGKGEGGKGTVAVGQKARQSETHAESLSHGKRRKMQKREGNISGGKEAKKREKYITQAMRREKPPGPVAFAKRCALLKRQEEARRSPKSGT